MALEVSTGEYNRLKALSAAVEIARLNVRDNNTTNVLIINGLVIQIR